MRSTAGRGPQGKAAKACVGNCERRCTDPWMQPNGEESVFQLCACRQAPGWCCRALAPVRVTDACCLSLPVLHSVLLTLSCLVSIFSCAVLQCWTRMHAWLKSDQIGSHFQRSNEAPPAWQKKRSHWEFFFSFPLYVGGIWKEDILVADTEELGKLDD